MIDTIFITRMRIDIFRKVKSKEDLIMILMMIIITTGPTMSHFPGIRVH